MEGVMARGNLILDRYEPIGVAGEGGFGTVRIAWDPRIQRKVAIKTIALTELDAARAALPGAEAVPVGNTPTTDRWHGAMPWDEYLATEGLYDGVPVDIPSGWEDEAASEQVTSLAHVPGLDEARTAAMLSDQHIVTVYDFEVRGQAAFLIMEYVEGITLSRLLYDYADYVTLDIIASVFDAVAGALVTAHKAGVLHLDIKPDNIIINTDGCAKVTDFGLATLADASGVGTTGGGTIGYMPLEQMRREPLDARTDEWALASVTYEMLTGDNPFRVDSLEEAQAAIENAELVLPSLCWNQIDEQIDDVLFYALDPLRDNRYASVDDFAEEVLKFLGDPDEGDAQLEAIVCDALGLVADEAEPDDYEWEDDDPIRPSRPRVGMLGVLAAVVDHDGERSSRRDAADDPDGFEDFDDSGGSVKPAKAEGRLKRLASKRTDGPALPLKPPEKLKTFASHAFGAAATALITLFALINLLSFVPAFGRFDMVIAGVIAVGIGAVGAVRPPLSALVSYILLGVAFALACHPLMGVVLLAAFAAWFYISGRDGLADANAALLGPIAGAFGGFAAVPILTGASLSPGRAFATLAFSSIIAIALASLGSMSLVGWDALAHWKMTSSTASTSVLMLLRMPATWATVAGWVAGGMTLSLLRMRKSRTLAIAGAIAAAAMVLAGMTVFAQPSVPAIVSAVIAVVAVVLFV